MHYQSQMIHTRTHLTLTAFGQIMIVIWQVRSVLPAERRGGEVDYLLSWRYSPKLDKQRLGQCSRLGRVDGLTWDHSHGSQYLVSLAS